MGRVLDSAAIRPSRAWGFLTPSLAGALLAVGVPLVAVLPLSTVRWDLLTQATWGHWENYLAVAADSQFTASLLTTVAIAILAVVFQLSCGILLGYFLARWTYGLRVFAAVMLLPWMAAAVATSIAWKWILSPTGGVLSEVLGFRFVGLTDAFWAPVLVASLIAWAGMGYTSLFVASGLRAIPQDIVSAACLDGASRWRIFWSIQLPHMHTLMLFLVVTVTLSALNTYDLVYVLTGGGPNDATAMATYSITQKALGSFEVGKSAAMAVLFTILEVVIIALEYGVYRILTRRIRA